MPLRLIAWLFALGAFLVEGAPARAAAPAATAHWEAVLAAGDVAEPVFDNGVAAFAQWLYGRGVLPGDIHRLSARQQPSDPSVEPASAVQLRRRIALLPERP